MEALREYRTDLKEISAGTFTDFIAYIDRTERTTRTYLTNLRQFAAWMKYKGITQPGRKDIILYRQWLQEEHAAIIYKPGTPTGWEYRTDRNGDPIKLICKANTVKIYLQSVKQFFKWTASNGIYPNIAENIHAPKVSANHKKDALTPSDVLAIENSITEHSEARTRAAAAAKKDSTGRESRSIEQGRRLKAIYLLAVNAGLRTIEISRANIKDIETKGGSTYIYIWGKGRSEADQKKPIAPEVKQAIDNYLECRTDLTGNAPLFTSTGNRSGGKRIAPTTISTMLKRAMQEAGFNSDRITAHSLRHTTAANVMQLTGNNIYQAQQYMRHTSPATTEIYLENDSTAQDEGIARQLYSLYHGADQRGGEQLQSILNTMSAAQMEALTKIAITMTKQVSN